MRELACRYALATLLTAIGSGCAHYELTVPQPNPAGQSWSVTYVTYLWGAVETRKVADKCDITNAIDQVRVHDNLLFDLVSVVTLGIVKPIRMEVTCGAPRNQHGETL